MLISAKNEETLPTLGIECLLQDSLQCNHQPIADYGKKCHIRFSINVDLQNTKNACYRQ